MMRRSIVVSMVIALVLLLASCPPGAKPGPNEYYVDAASGSDLDAGSVAAPFKTITHAISVAMSGDVIRVLPGTYDAANGEQFPVVVPPGVALIGDEANKGQGVTPTVVSGGGYQVSVLDAALVPGDGSTVAGLTVTGILAESDFVVSILLSSSNVTVRNNSVVDSTSDWTAAIYCNNSAANLIIDGNIIEYNTGLGLGFIGGGYDTIVQNNVVRHNWIGVEYDSAGGDLGGGAMGSVGNNIITCNSNTDLWTNQAAITIDAADNYWDHNPPSGNDVYNGNEASIIVTGSAVAAEPCP